MTHEENNPEQMLNRAVSALRSQDPENAAVQDAAARLWSRLQAGADPAVEQIRGCPDVRALLPAYAAGQLPPARALLVRDHLSECVGCRKLARSGREDAVTWAAPVLRVSWSFRQFATAAAVLLVVALSAAGVAKWYFSSPAGMRARVQSVDGALYRVSARGEAPLRIGEELGEGEVIRTAARAHAFLQLRDGSVVEMNERAQLAVRARRSDTTVNLDQGRIIVQAAKRRTGHLYVSTPDCRVAVTGTVFAVNAGMKGSRVSVVEGEVHVYHGGSQDVVHSGEQAATSDSLSPVPVPDDISWSQNLDKHLALLAQFAVLQKKFQHIPVPGLRYSSAILDRLPADTVVYGNIPNLGEALNQANRIFQEQLQQSAVLREWWESGNRRTNAPSFNEIVQKLHALSQYLGDEVALICLSGQPAGEAGAAVIAEVRRPGLAELLQTQFTSTQEGAGPQMRVVDEPQLTALPADSTRKLTALVRPDFVLFSGSVRTLQVLNAQLNAGAGGFAATGFGRRIGSVYARGAGLLIAFDLGRIIAEARLRNPARDPQREASFQQTGFGDASYLIAEHRELSGTPDNRAELDFSGPRRGVASWLAPPAPIGSLEFVSADAGVAVSFVIKSPALMLDDVLRIASAKDPNSRSLAGLEAKLNLNLRDDLAAAFGGDMTLALDGPILPKPAWKLVAEVYDPARVQSSFQKLVAAVNNEAALHNRPGIEMQQEEAQGRTYYTIRSLDPAKLNAEVHYTFADGYFIMAPSRALVVDSLSAKSSANSLARSADFKALLPRDEHDNCSAIMYQNLAPVIQPIASQLTAEQLQSLQQIAAGAKPSVVCAYGLDTRIQVVSTGRLLPFDLSTLTISTLLGASRHTGTSSAPHP